MYNFKLYKYYLAVICTVALQETGSKQLNSKIVIKENYSHPTIEKFCPATKYCTEGSHVKCMFSNPAGRFNPQCRNPIPQNMTHPMDYKTMIIEIINELRGFVALNKSAAISTEEEEDEVLLRGYGMMRVEWHDELAEYAQILADQCMYRNDLCRATDEFPDPGQIMCAFNNAMSDEEHALDASVRMTNKSEERFKMHAWQVTDIIKKCFSHWHSFRNELTREQLQNIPLEYLESQEKSTQRNYLLLLTGNLTKVGCGITTYISKTKAGNYNTLSLICNLNMKFEANKPLYRTRPPSSDDIGMSLPCGCPWGYDQDDNCLCYKANMTAKEPQSSCYKETENQKPQVVLLPIFTVEELPQDVLDIYRPSNATRKANVKKMNIHANRRRKTLKPTGV